jgi:glycosyltransferase involved in cell wall biosynthesis
MAMGKAIVASRLGQIGEVLKHEETALLVSPGNSQELSAAIIRFAESRSLRETLGSAARSTAVANHTWTRNAQNILDAYERWRDTTRDT